MPGYYPGRSVAFDSTGHLIKEQGKSAAELRFSGIFLHKNGSVGSIRTYTADMQRNIQSGIIYEYYCIIIQKA